MKKISVRQRMIVLVMVGATLLANTQYLSVITAKEEIQRTIGAKELESKQTPFTITVAIDKIPTLELVEGELKQVNVEGNIDDIVIRAKEGYYLEDDYGSKLQAKYQNGLIVTQNGNEIRISGTLAEDESNRDIHIMLGSATNMKKAPSPEVEIVRSSNAISANITNADKEQFGIIEYQWNGGNWSEKQTNLSNLLPNTQHTLSVRFKGNRKYYASDITTMSVTTLKNGNLLIHEPINLEGIFQEGLRLSDIDLTSFSGWSWVDGNTLLTVGKNKYPARFSTQNLESEYDFIGVEGYHAQGHYIERSLVVDIEKGDSTLTITNTLDKVYDGEASNEPIYTKSGSKGEVKTTWLRNVGSIDSPKWEELGQAPISAGHYKVNVALAEDDNYKGAQASLEFKITKVDNNWIQKPSLASWVYGEKEKQPVAKAKFGEVVFTYSKNINEIGSQVVPQNAGKYYLNATVIGNKNYTGIKESVAFEIKKAKPILEVPSMLLLGKGDKLKSLALPEGYVWVDNEQIANQLGTHAFAAIYTPTDTNNYESVEVTIVVQVVPKVSSINMMPTIEADNQTLVVGDIFDPFKNVVIKDKEDDKNGKKLHVEIKHQVNTDLPGIYEVIYRVTDSGGASTTKIIQVKVLPPMASLNHAPEIYVEDIILMVNEVFDTKKALQYVSAKDIEDGNISHRIEVIKNGVDTSKAGNYQVTYRVVDLNGASVIKTIQVVVLPPMASLNHAPKIYADDIILMVNEVFDTKKALRYVSAKDKEDGDISHRIEVIKNSVDTSKAGNYQVTYQVVDSNGARVTKTVLVHVKNSQSITEENQKPSNTQEQEASSEKNDDIINEEKKDSSVGTGDATNFLAFVALMGTSALLLIGILSMKKRFIK